MKNQNHKSNVTCQMSHVAYGFTLLEIVVVIAIGALILITVGALIVTQINLYHTQTITGDLSVAVASTFGQVQRIVTGARTVATSHIFNGTTYTTDEDTLVVALPSIRESGDLIPNQLDFAVFYLSGTDLYSQIDASPESTRPETQKLLGHFIQRLTFRYNTSSAADANLVTIELSLRRLVGENPETAHGETTILLRNK